MKIHLIYFLVFLFTSVRAQVDFGITAGLNASSQIVSYNRSTRFGDYGGPYDFKVGYVMGYQAGVSISTRFNNRLSLKTDVLYSGKGQTEMNRSRTTGDIKDYTDHINYIIFPVSLAVDLGSDKDKGFFVLGGAYVSRAIKVNSRLHYHYSNIDVTHNAGAEIDNNIEIWNPDILYLKAFDIGIKSGIGYRSGLYSIQLINELGLVNNISHINEFFINGGPLTDYSNQSTRKNLTWSATVTCFPFKKISLSSADANPDIRFGIRTGVNASNVSSDKSTHAIGLGGGVFTLFNFAKRWGLRTELVHSSFGTNTNETGEFKINRISIPALLNFSFGKVTMEAGPELNYLLHMKTRSVNIEIDEKLREWDYGLSFGIEYSPVEMIGVSLRNYFGLIQQGDVYVYKKASPEVIKSGKYNILSLSLNYYFHRINKQ